MKERIDIRIDPEAKKLAMRAAKKGHRSLTSLIRHLLAKYCDKVLGK